MDRVALLTPNGGTGTDYDLIKLYYKQRNNIAHGGSFTISVHIPTAVHDMKRLFSALRP